MCLNPVKIETYHPINLNNDGYDGDDDDDNNNSNNNNNKQDSPNKKTNQQKKMDLVQFINYYHHISSLYQLWAALIS